MGHLDLDCGSEPSSKASNNRSKLKKVSKVCYLRGSDDGKTNTNTNSISNILLKQLDDRSQLSNPNLTKSLTTRATPLPNTQSTNQAQVFRENNDKNAVKLAFNLKRKLLGSGESRASNKIPRCNQEAVRPTEKTMAEPITKNSKLSDLDKIFPPTIPHKPRRPRNSSRSSETTSKSTRTQKTPTRTFIDTSKSPDSLPPRPQLNFTTDKNKTQERMYGNDVFTSRFFSQVPILPPKPVSRAKKLKDQEVSQSQPPNVTNVPQKKNISKPNKLTASLRLKNDFKNDNLCQQTIGNLSSKSNKIQSKEINRLQNILEILKPSTQHRSPQIKEKDTNPGLSKNQLDHPIPLEQSPKSKQQVVNVSNEHKEKYKMFMFQPIVKFEASDFYIPFDFGDPRVIQNFQNRENMYKKKQEELKVSKN